MYEEGRNQEKTNQIHTISKNWKERNGKLKNLNKSAYIIIIIVIINQIKRNKVAIKDIIKKDNLNYYQNIIIRKNDQKLRKNLENLKN